MRLLRLAYVPLSACIAHAPLQLPPPPDAPPDVRAQAYAALAPAGTNTITTVTVGRNYASVEQSTSLILHNGQTVWAAEDLIPLVEPNSPAALAAQRAAEARSSSLQWTWGGVAAVLIGTSVFLAAGLQTTQFDSQGNTTQDAGITTAGWLGLAVATIGGIIGFTGGVIYKREAAQETMATFATYDDGLRARLRMCVNGLQVIPCP